MHQNDSIYHKLKHAIVYIHLRKMNIGCSIEHIVGLLLYNSIKYEVL